jgi:hypothetical protein
MHALKTDENEFTKNGRKEKESFLIFTYQQYVYSNNSGKVYSSVSMNGLFADGASRTRRDGAATASAQMPARQ